MTHAFNFGAKIAASMCTPCDTPNSAANKKHMTGASPAVTEAGEHSEEIGKPPVTETEHSEAEAKQPEEGIKSAANFGKMLGGLFGAAKPAVSNAAQAATAAVRKPIVGQFPPAGAAGTVKITPGDIANRFGTGRQIASPALPTNAPKVKISPAEAAAGRAAVKITPQDVAASSGNGMVGGKWTGADSINPANVPIPRGQMRPNGFSESDIRAAQGANLQPVRRSTGTDTMQSLAGPQGPAAPPPTAPKIKITPAEAAAATPAASNLPEYLRPHGGMTPIQRSMYRNQTGQVAPKPRTVGEFNAARGDNGPYAFPK